MQVPKDLRNREKWAGLKTIGVAIRYSECGEKWSTEVRYYISSIAKHHDQLSGIDLKVCVVASGDLFKGSAFEPLGP